jgi:hypothetical protein
MAVDKLVDSTQLDADLTSVANAIRTKGGTSADLVFPAGFVSAVQAIPTGGGGADLVKHTGSFTNASDSYHYEVTGLGAPAFVVLVLNRNITTFDGTKRALLGIYADGFWGTVRTNSTGTASSFGNISHSPEGNLLNGRTVQNDGYVATGGAIAATTTGFSISFASNYPMKAGDTFDYVCYTLPED